MGSLARRYSGQVLQARQQADSADLEKFVAALSARHELLFFVMRASLDIGDQCQIHFFEPRYRWLVDRVMQQPDDGSDLGRFGFVTSGRCEPGATGVVCKIVHHTRCPDGSFDIVILGCDRFVIEQVSMEAVPAAYIPGGPAVRSRVPPLFRGKVSFTRAAATGGGETALAGAGAEARSIPPELVVTILQGAIARGVPMWNAGNTAGCAALYRRVAEQLREADVRLDVALQRCEGRNTGAGRDSQGWVLRYAFDDILQDPWGGGAGRAAAQIDSARETQRGARGLCAVM